MSHNCVLACWNLIHHRPASIPELAQEGVWPSSLTNCYKIFSLLAYLILKKHLLCNLDELLWWNREILHIAWYHDLCISTADQLIRYATQILHVMNTNGAQDLLRLALLAFVPHFSLTNTLIAKFCKLLMYLHGAWQHSWMQLHTKLGVLQCFRHWTWK